MLVDKLKKWYNKYMQMIQFDDIDALNKFLAENKEDPSMHVKSVKTQIIKNVPNFFVLVDEVRGGYRPRSY